MAKSKGNLINRHDLGEMIGVTGQRVSAMVREGIFKQRSDGLYDLLESAKAACQWLRERNQNGDLGALKRMKLEQEIAISKHTLEIHDRTYVRVTDVQKPYEHRILLCRQKLLRLGNKIAPRIPYLKTENEIEGAINTEIEEALRELARPVDFDTELGPEE